MKQNFYTPGEVAIILRVDAKTVTRWTNKIKEDGEPVLASIRTPGGHRRIPVEAVQAILRGDNK